VKPGRLQRQHIAHDRGDPAATAASARRRENEEAHVGGIARNQLLRRWRRGEDLRRRRLGLRVRSGVRDGGERQGDGERSHGQIMLPFRLREAVMNFSFVHEFDCDVKTYWKIFLSPDFNKDMFAELKMKDYKVIQQTDDGKMFHREQSLEPTTPIPGFLQSIIKSTGYTEVDDLDWSTNVMKVKIITAMFKDKFDMHGDYSVQPLGDGKRVRREFRGEVKVSIALIGGKIEKYMMEQMRDSYEIAARVTRKWIEKEKAGGVQ
jgi:hypothetical protein